MIETSEFINFVRPLIGMNVSLPWSGYGSTIFLELGKLSSISSHKQRHQDGEACLWFDWDWRLENDKTIICGSSNSKPEIKKAIDRLCNLKLSALKTEGTLPELIVEFINGYILRSMSMVSGDPQWNIRLPEATWLSCVNGELVHNNCNRTGATQEEKHAMKFASSTAERWGTPISEPRVGICQSCSYFVPIDGNFELLDYGVCTSSNSLFDGRVTNIESGCQFFRKAGIVQQGFCTGSQPYF